LQFKSHDSVLCDFVLTDSATWQPRVPLLWRAPDQMESRRRRVRKCFEPEKI
jgi:hypothetical protein